MKQHAAQDHQNNLQEARLRKKNAEEKHGPLRASMKMILKWIDVKVPHYKHRKDEHEHDVIGDNILLEYILVHLKLQVCLTL